MTQTKGPVGERAAERSAFHIPSLDGIRAISFLIVFLGHAGLERYVPGYFGLSLFFFLSGYLITTLLRLEYARTQSVSLKDFYLRRVLRIFPPFYIVLIVATVITALGWSGGTLSGPALAAQFLHFTNYWVVGHGWWEGMAPGTWVYWSLAVEEHFYLVFPLMFAWMQRTRRSVKEQTLALVAVCAVVLVWRSVLIFVFKVAQDRTYVATDTRIDSIIAGCILAIGMNPVLDAEKIDRSRLLWLWLPLGTAAVLLSLGVREFHFDQTLRYTLQSFGLAPFFMAAIVWWDRWPFRVLNLRPLRYLGTISYSMYLMHTAAIWLFDRWVPWPKPVRNSLLLVLLVLLGTVMYRLVELPCARVRHRLARYLKTPSAARAAATSPSA